MINTEKFWKDVKISQPKFMHGWCSNDNMVLLTKILDENPDMVYVELGSWYGASCKYVLDKFPKIKVIAIDIWDDNLTQNSDWINKNNVPCKLAADLHNINKKHPLYDTFLANFYEYKDRILPIRSDTISGLRTVHSIGIESAIFYIDGDHTYPTVKQELELIYTLFKNPVVCGDDYTYPGVKKAVDEIARKHQFKVSIIGRTWYLN